VVEQRIPRLLNGRWESAGGEAERARPGSVVLNTGRKKLGLAKNQQVDALGCGGSDGISRLGEEGAMSAGCEAGVGEGGEG
jgi:hypothetical protein